MIGSISTRICYTLTILSIRILLPSYNMFEVGLLNSVSIQNTKHGVTIKLCCILPALCIEGSLDGILWRLPRPSFCKQVAVYFLGDITLQYLDCRLYKKFIFFLVPKRSCFTDSKEQCEQKEISKQRHVKRDMRRS